MIMKLLCYNYLPTLCDYILDFPQQSWHEQAISYLKKINRIAVFYMHQPIVWRLEHIGKVTRENGIGVLAL